MTAGRGEVPRQDIHPVGDAFVAGRDFHYHAAAAGQQAPSCTAPVLAGDVPQTPPGFSATNRAAGRPSTAVCNG